MISEEPIIIKTFENFLRDLGHEVTCFKSISAFLLEDKNNPNVSDLIIVDLDMPKNIAVKRISEIHSSSLNTPILVMSSILPSHEAIINGVYSYLKKPISFAELELVLARVSERQSRLKPESSKDNFNNCLKVSKDCLSDTKDLYNSSFRRVTRNQKNFKGGEL